MFSITFFLFPPLKYPTWLFNLLKMKGTNTFSVLLSYSGPFRQESVVGMRRNTQAFEQKASRVLDLYEGVCEGNVLSPSDCVIRTDEKTIIQARRRRHPKLLDSHWTSNASGTWAQASWSMGVSGHGKVIQR